MMRALFSGVSGLKTHQTKMDVIGNNIANVNTVAYKSSSITFSALMSQTTQKASGPNATTGVGGVNARQIGLGVKSGAINTAIATQGASQSTGNPFDVMINGDAFFVVSNGSENFFTRDGSFYVDAAGNLAMTSNGYNVMGWGVDPETQNIKQDTVAALRIMSAANMTYPPEATTAAYVAGIIDKNDTDVTSSNGKVMNLNFFDALGYNYTAKLVMRKGDAAKGNEYGVELVGLLDSVGNSLDISGVVLNKEGTEWSKETKVTKNSDYTWNGKELQTTDGDGNTVTVANLANIFDNAGNLLTESTDEAIAKTATDELKELAKAYGYEGSEEEFLKLYTKVTDATGAETTVSIQKMLSNLALGTGTPAFDTTADEMTMDGRLINGAIVTYDANKGHFSGIGGNPQVTSITLGMSALGGNFEDITIDFSESAMYDNKGTSTIGAKNGDTSGKNTGRRLGDMSGITIQKNGMIYASYDNGMTRLLGQIATAEFANASGLEKVGDNLYSATLNSGEFDGIGTDLTANGGSMSTGQLEMSNVDLSAEFTEMITTQRGFQANSRIITVSDTLLEELTNLKR